MRRIQEGGQRADGARGDGGGLHAGDCNVSAQPETGLLMCSRELQSLVSHQSKYSYEVDGNAEMPGKPPGAGRFGQVCRHKPTTPRGSPRFHAPSNHRPGPCGAGLLSNSTNNGTNSRAAPGNTRSTHKVHPYVAGSPQVPPTDGDIQLGPGPVTERKRAAEGGNRNWEHEHGVSAQERTTRLANVCGLGLDHRSGAGLEGGGGDSGPRK